MVAPPVGAWIEIYLAYETSSPVRSLPPWERGLKYILEFIIFECIAVAPPVGAWIEIAFFIPQKNVSKSRSPRGSVD